MQDLYEERRNQFFSNLGDVEEWLKQTKEVVQKALLEEKEQQEQDSEEQSTKVVKQAEAFQGVASQQSESDRQAVMDNLISTLKATLIQWNLADNTCTILTQSVCVYCFCTYFLHTDIRTYVCAYICAHCTVLC